VWLYYRFPLSFCEVEEMMLQRGIVVFHETVRQWCAKFGQAYANQLRRRRPRPGDKWRLDRTSTRCSSGSTARFTICGGPLTSAPGHAQRFLSAFSGISPHFRPRRHRLAAEQYRREMAVRFTTWNEVTGLTTAA
jgi:hypothetical protein